MSYPVFMGAIVLTSANNRLRVKEGAGAVTSVDLTPGTYYLRDTSLGAEVENAIFNTLGTNSYTFTFVYDIDPANIGIKASLARQTGSADFSIVVDGSETFDYSLIGFSTSASTAHNGSDKVSTTSCAGGWVGTDIYREREPFGERVVSVPRKANGGVVGVSRTAHMTSWALGLSFLHEDRALRKLNTSDPSATLEAFLRRFGAGAAFEAYESLTVSGTQLTGVSSAFGVLHWSEDSLSSFRPRRIGPGVPLYDIDLVAHQQVTS